MLREVHISEENADYMSFDNVIYTRDKTKLILYPAGRTAPVYTVINDCHEIGMGAFENAMNLYRVILPDTVTYINGNAFKNCVNLAAVNIPSGVKTIQSYAFAGCDVLRSLIVLPSTEQIYTKIFGFDSNGNLYKNAVIYGDENTAVQKYALSNGITFRLTADLVKGDANCDCALNVRDCAYIARILSQGRGYVLTENADFNDDSKIDVRDSVEIARFLAEKH